MPFSPKLSLLLREAEREHQTQHALSSRSTASAASSVPHAIIRLTKYLLQSAVDRNASDLHLETMENGLQVHLRCDGILTEPEPPIPLALAPLILSRLKVMAGMDVTNHQTPDEGHIPSADALPDIRVSSIPTVDGERMVLRFMENTGTSLSLDELGYEPQTLKQFRTLIHQPQGLIIITGPMGSGKSSTLYAAIEELKTPSASIITLEDPVERRIQGITQIQINPQTGLTFPVGLRALLRQDCQCILLGEIRDEETAKLAVRIALTGHLVLTTLHTSEAISAIFRLLEMGVPHYLLAATLTGIVSQRLVRRLCPSCRQQYEPDDWENALFSQPPKSIGDHCESSCVTKTAPVVTNPTLYRASEAGCPDCHGSGYAGRLALSELIPLSRECQQLLLNRQPMSAFRAWQKENALPTLWQDGIAKCRKGETSLAEIQRVLGTDKASDIPKMHETQVPAGNPL